MSSDSRKSDFVFKRDGYSKSRGGTSVWFIVFCRRCDHAVLLYQKDGPGNLLRLYLDRIFAPDDLVGQENGVDKIPNLTCQNCQNVLATPMVYKPERRLAYRLNFNRSYKKKSAVGQFPPAVEEDENAEEKDVS